jgi:hypothetical protein
MTFDKNFRIFLSMTLISMENAPQAEHHRLALMLGLICPFVAYLKVLEVGEIFVDRENSLEKESEYKHEAIRHVSHVDMLLVIRRAKTN